MKKLLTLLGFLLSVGVQAQYVDLAHNVQGTLPYTNGGTGLSSTGGSGGFLISNGSGWVAFGPCSGQTYLQGAGTASPLCGTSVPYIAGGGSADAITATYSPAIASLVDGMVVSFSPTAANATTTPTFAPNGLTAHTIVKNNGSALVSGDIPGSSARVLLAYNLSATNWILINPAVASTVTTNANLTGVITSSGNTTSIGSQTGTGSKFVVDTSPTIATPILTTPAFNGFTECSDTPTITAGAVTLANTICTFHKLSLVANTTITLPTPVAGQSYTAQVCYGGVYTVTWAGGGTLSWPAATAPIATSVNGKCDFYVFTAHDTTYTYGQDGGRNFTGS